MIKKIISIILVLIWMGLIFSFSNSNGESSGSMSRTVIVKIAELFTGYKDSDKEMDAIVDKYSFLVRKGAHFFEYFVLAFLVMNSLYICGVSKKILLISGIICILYAISDEVHQLFISDRSGNVIDVMWDSSASLISNYLFYLYINHRSKHEKRSAK